MQLKNKTSAQVQTFSFLCHNNWTVHCCKVSKHFALCPQKWDGLLGTWTEGKEDEWVQARLRTLTQKTKEAMGRCQNNKHVKAVSACHCAATSVLRHCCFNCCAEQRHKDNGYVVEHNLGPSLGLSNAHSPRTEHSWCSLDTQSSRSHSAAATGCSSPCLHRSLGTKRDLNIQV